MLMTDPSALDRLASDADRLAMDRRRVPASTYRLQMHAEFPLREAARISAYLRDLGITHPYTSSLVAAKPGSTHGYDVTDPTRLNPELGTDDEFDAWVADLRQRGMGLLLDAVPNHMSVPNNWIYDLLEHGQSSPYAGYFDIAWNDHPRERLRGKVLLPILGQPYGVEIEAGNFRVEFADGTLALKYGEQRLPIDPRTYGTVLGPAADAVRGELGAEHEDAVELQSILTGVRHLPPRTDTDPEKAAEGWNESRVLKRRLADLGGRNPVVAGHIADSAKRLSGVTGDPASFTGLEELLDAQAYRPSFWRVASDEINYRRFFDINELAALNTEREDVFAAVHQKVFEWVGAGQLDGLRIDHPDGLFDPKEYLDRLQLYTRLAAARHLLQTKPDDYPGLTWSDLESPLKERFAAEPKRPLYVVVEKILGEGEPLPETWATDGTTGYEFINLINGLFVDAAREKDMTRVYRDLTGEETRFDELVYRSKFHVLQSSLASELHMLGHQLDRLAQLQRWSRDFTLNGLRHALREVIACFPVYRSYVNGGVTDRDKVDILRAVSRAKRRNPLLGRAVFDFIRDTLLLKDPPSGPATPEYRAAQRRFAGKFQQVTAPTMAKGFEDTALYIYNRLASLNEVGGEPSKFGRSPAEIHQALRTRAEKFPGGLSPLSTHDTKRSEDVRTRINVLSEMPDAWAARVSKWMGLNLGHKIDVGEGQLAIDPNEEYLLYQTLIGAWPVGGLTPDNRSDFVGRIQGYMNKALHEAKVHTSWINPNPEYDAAASEFVARILDPGRAVQFLADFEPFQQTVSHFGMFGSLAQTLLKVTAPGVPDTYQGTDLWDFSLVDPDNRRPVDYGLRARYLAEFDERSGDPAGLVRELVDHKEDGRVKLYVLSRALRFRREHANVFGGSYTPIDVVGPQAGHVFCFVRMAGDECVLIVVPRLIATLVPSGDRPPTGSQVWGETALLLPPELPAAGWTNVMTGEVIESPGDRTLPVAGILGSFPVALLECRRPSR
jgi:(1->4)-alpha-D-glucan 1-alpha-D-glucosylmutase